MSTYTCMTMNVKYHTSVSSDNRRPADLVVLAGTLKKQDPTDTAANLTKYFVAAKPNGSVLQPPRVVNTVEVHVDVNMNQMRGLLSHLNAHVATYKAAEWEAIQTLEHQGRQPQGYMPRLELQHTSGVAPKPDSVHLMVRNS